MIKHVNLTLKVSYLLPVCMVSDSSPLSVSLQISVNKPPSSNCANVITSPVCSLEDVAYGVYVTVGRIAIAFAYGRDAYDNALELFFVKHNIVLQNYLSSTGYIHKVSFLMLWYSHEDAAKPFLCLVTHV